MKKPTNDRKQNRGYSAQFVIDHAQWKSKRGKNPSLQFWGERNPIKALNLAHRLSNDNIASLLLDNLYEEDLSVQLLNLVRIGVETWSIVVDKSQTDKELFIESISKKWDKGEYITSTNNKEAFLNFIASCWDGAEQQIKIRAMEVEGMVMGEDGAAINLGWHLAMYGIREKLILA